MLEDIKKTLWASADKLRANMDAAEYKHLVLGLIFVKYISDAFVARQAELSLRLRDPADELFYGNVTDEDIAAEIEDRDYYTSENVFWVPEGARWEALRAAAPQPDIGKRVDDALTVIELDNPKLKGILDKRFARAQLPDGKLGELVNLISTIGFGDDPSKVRDILGQVYEYFLGMFASAEGKRGGQFYTPASIVKTLVAVLSPAKGQIYDPCCGSSGMFVQSEKFIEDHGGKLGDVSIYGQEANPTTWRLAAMNLVIRGMDYNLGKEPADTFTRNQHPDLRADYCLANPPFNISDWWHASLDGDARWVYGTPPQGNANYAWLQHILHHLKPTGRAGIVLANGSMSSSQNSEGQIRAAMVDADVVEVMVALPGQLFFNTQIPACLWFLAKQKKRKGEVLFIDARKLATMISRVQSELTDEVIERISQTVAAWRNLNTVRAEPVEAQAYHDIPGFCRSVPLAEIAQHGHVLTPGRYVGAEEVEDDDEAFADKMQTLTARLSDQIAKGAELDALIRQKLGGWGMSSELSATSPEYRQWLADLKGRYRHVQLKAAVVVNTAVLEFYWDLGADILARQSNTAWGQGFLTQLSADLMNEFPGVAGFSKRNLEQMRRWVSFWSHTPQIAKQPASQLMGIPWWHHVVILTKCKEPEEALYYVQQTQAHGWSRSVLTHQIESGLWQREGCAITNFAQTLPAPHSDLARQVLKDPYVFDFLSLTPEHTERELETALIEHVTQFLLELGAGFAYLGRQVPLQVGERDFFIDLLFYHVRLHCYVVVELKTVDFEPEFAGKLNFYLQAVDAQMRQDGDAPTIGLLLCKSKDRLVAEYALSDIQKPMGLSTYTLSHTLPEALRGKLPSIEQLEQELGAGDKAAVRGAGI